MNERERERVRSVLVRLKVNGQPSPMEGKGVYIGGGKKVTVWGTGWSDVRRTSDVRRPKWVRTSDSHRTTGRCEKCDPQSSVQDTDVRAGPNIRKNASDVKVSDVRRVPDIRRNVSVGEMSDIRKCPDVRAIRKDRTSVEHRTCEGKVYR